MDPQGFQQWTRPLSIMPRSTSSKCPLINRLESSIFLLNKAKYLSPASCCGCGSWSIWPSSTWSRRRLPRRCCCCRDGGECPPDLFSIKLFSMIPMAGFAAVQGHDDKSSNVSRWFLISSSCGSSNGIARTKCFGGGGSNVRAWTQCLCGCFYGIDGLWPPGGISQKICTPWPFDTQSHLQNLESTFTSSYCQASAAGLSASAANSAAATSYAALYAGLMGQSGLMGFPPGAAPPGFPSQGAPRKE